MTTTSKNASPKKAPASPRKTSARSSVDDSAILNFPAGRLTEMARATQEKTRQQIEAGMELTANNVERMADQMMTSMDDMMSWQKNMTEACTNYWTSVGKGYEEISKAVMTSCQNNAQQYMQCMQSMLTAKSMKDAMDTQSEFVRGQMDSMMSEGTKLSEICTKLASEASEPMQSQWSSMMNGSYNSRAA